ncbi:RagB/SusD family nutrient uptake outer membrane protein [Prolixibacteraceae bacterium JC049]|nr:RagB/SusD family nutrient uptake outer membrane protein [Prolixibacteraceae bacterium JC049]
MQTVRSTLILMVFIHCFSCNNFLEKQPDDALTLDTVFARRAETERYLMNVFSYLPDEANIWNGTPWLGSSDEADITWERDSYATYQINLGNFGPLNSQFNFWKSYYQGIRSASVFLERVDECKELTPKELIQYKAEARFLRAVFHFFLLRQYGPIILIDEALGVDVDFNQSKYTRQPYDLCINFIVTELQQSMKDLPLIIDDPKWYGRPTKGAAMAFKARALLYAASPLYNGNTTYSNFKNSEEEELISQKFSIEKWKKAADANKDIIDLDIYHLYKNQNFKKPEENNDPFLSYKNLFLEPWNQEIIFARAQNSSNSFEQHCSPRSVNGWNGCSVTQQQVDAYFMSNGKMIDEPESGYMEEGFSTKATRFTPEKVWNMYINREPRFYVSVAFNGMEWPFDNHQLELYSSGLDGKQGSHDHSRTGYLIHKMVSPNSDIQNARYSSRPWIFIRLGEIYLNYAEALNEYDPGNPDIALYVNKIRERAGLPDLPEGLSQDEMRKRIRRERRVELAFEGHRFFDTRRWKIAEKTDGGPFWGMNTDSGDSITDVSFYERTIFENRVFESKNYLWPIPQSEINKHSLLIQNPGW